MIYDLIIIGAGQAGLAVAYYAQRQGLNFVIFESNGRIGDNWRKRYDCLELFSTRRLSGLPGLKFPGPAHGYPHKDEAADYLEHYLKHWGFPIILGSKVRSVTKQLNLFTVNTKSKDYIGRAVVVAAGGFQSAQIPKIPGHLNTSIVQLHSSQYQNARQVPLGNTLVVGSGNSGAAIAVQLAATHHVEISSRSPLRFHSREGWNKTLPYIARAFGIIYAKHSSVIGKRVRRFGIPIIGLELKTMIAQKKVGLVSQILRFDGSTVVFIDGTKRKYSAIIWCTGFRPNLSWIKLTGALDVSGKPIHHFGISPVKGLYYIGLHWQRSLASALMGGVGHDAKFITKKINHHLLSK